MPEKIQAAGVIILLTVLSYLVFPGHTYLQSDTQIYVPILEHYWDRSVLGEDLIVQNPHLSFTVYDEVSLALRQLTGLDFEGVLTFQQLVFRGLGFAGVYMIATSLGLAAWPALLVTAVHALGATIIGPAVLVIEYEPVPRGFAVALILLAVGMAAHGRDLGAGLAASVAFLYHPPTVWIYWLIYFALTLYPGRPQIMSRHIAGLLPLLCAVLALLFLSRLQAGVGEHQSFFTRIDPGLEQIQRLRSSYNWISSWLAGGSSFREWPLIQYLFLWLVCLAATRRVWNSVAQDLRFFLVGLPLLGMLSAPASYILLERMKWILIPQIQPARGLLFVTALALILGAVAAAKAVENSRYRECALWLCLVFAIPAGGRVLTVLLPADALGWKRLGLSAGLAVLFTATLWLVHERRRLGPLAVAAAVLPFFLLPTFGEVQNYPHLRTAELVQLSAWARASTPKTAMFLFPDAGRALYPGIFRAEAERAVYVDWKSGGQANFLKKLGAEWRTRWDATMGRKFDSDALTEFRKRKIDYVVVERQDALPGAATVFENSRYLVYATPGE